MITGQPVHFLGSIVKIGNSWHREIRCGVFSGMIDTCGGTRQQYLVETAEGAQVVDPRDTLNDPLNARGMTIVDCGKATCAIGDWARIREGACGAGYRFRVSSIYEGAHGPQVYGDGDGYGPVDAHLLERVGGPS